jgi:hypothetical protein
MVSRGSGPTAAARSCRGQLSGSSQNARRRIGKYRVDFPFAAVCARHPEFVLNGVAARHVVLVAEFEPLAIQPRTLSHDLTRGADLDASRWWRLPGSPTPSMRPSFSGRSAIAKFAYPACASSARSRTACSRTRPPRRHCSRSGPVGLVTCAPPVSMWVDIDCCIDDCQYSHMKNLLLRARERCASSSRGVSQRLHWPLEDPAAGAGERRRASGAFAMRLVTGYATSCSTVPPRGGDGRDSSMRGSAPALFREDHRVGDHFRKEER